MAIKTGFDNDGRNYRAWSLTRAVAKRASTVVINSKLIAPCV